MTEIIGVVIGFVLGVGVTHWERRRRLKAHWSALQVELEMVQRAAQTYRTDSVKAPLYRLPTIAVDQALPELLTAGVLKPAELHSLLSCGLLVRDINRGLDQAASIAPRTIDEEANRLTLKCRHLLDEPNHEASVERALAIVARHVRRHDWYR